MKEKIIVTVIPRDEAPYMKVIPNTLEAFQELVDGYIEVIPIGTGALAIVNEEGLFTQEFNCEYFGALLHGTIVVCGDGGEDFEDCPQIFLDMANIVTMGIRFAQLHSVEDWDALRERAVEMALEAMRNKREG